MMKSAGFEDHLERGSASIDPYELVPVDTAENVVISQWIAHVEKELAEHRSPFVAANIIYKQMHEKAVEIRHPDKFFLETSLHVLERCAHHLASPFKELFLSALHELLPALVLTRATHSPEKGEETFAKYTYAECFLSIYKVFLHHRRLIEVHGRRIDVECKVLDRLIGKLEGFWVRFCFTAWRMHTKRVKEKKATFARIAKVHLICQVTSTMIGRWRHLANSTMMGEKKKRTTLLTKELETLKTKVATLQEEAAKRREDVRTGSKMLQTVISELEASRTKKKDMQELLDFTKQSAREHWREWRRCMTLLFQDAYFSREEQLEIRRREKGEVHFISNITDSSVLYYNRARALASKVDMTHIHCLLMAYGLYAPSERLVDAPLLLPSNPITAMILKSESRAPLPYFSASSSPQGSFSHYTPHSQGTPGSTTYSSPVAKAKRGELIPYSLPTPSIETVSALLSLACGPVVSPFSMQDAAHFHRDKISFVASFLNFLFAGGHCSLFAPPPAMLTATTPSSASEHNERSTWTPKSREKVPRGTSTSPSTLTTSLALSAYKESGGVGNTLSLLNFSIDADGSSERKKNLEVFASKTEGGGAEELLSASLKKEDSISSKEGAEQDEEEWPIPEDGIGELMLSNVTQGLEHLQSTCAGRDELSSCIRRCMVHNDVDKVRNYLEGLFEQLSTMELPLNRYKIEEVTRRTVSSRSDYRVLKALYPSEGIASFGSLVNYLTSVAEFTSWPLMNVAEMVETLYEIDWRDEMKLALHSPDLRDFFSSNHRLIRRLQHDLADSEVKEELSSGKVYKMFTEKIGISDDDMSQMWQNAGQKLDVVMASELNQLLYLVGNWKDPSPFNQPLQKILRILEDLFLSTKAKGRGSLQ